MAITETQRTTLHNQLTGAIGQEAAETLMDQLPPSGWDWNQVATKDDIKALDERFSSQLSEAEGRLMARIAGSESRQGARVDDTNLRIDKTNTRIDETNLRIDETNTRLDKTNRELSELTGEVRTGFADLRLALARHTLWMAVAVIGVAASLAVPLMVALF